MDWKVVNIPDHVAKGEYDLVAKLINELEQDGWSLFTVDQGVLYLTKFPA